ncbi:MAG: WD40 repeat protein, partial [Candidatus Paceibacteria bacterium]
MLILTFPRTLGLALLILAPSSHAQEFTAATRRAAALAERAALRNATDVLESSPIRWLDGNGGAVLAKPSPDGERVLSLTPSGEVFLWGAWLGDPIAQLGLCSAEGVSFGFDSTGDVIFLHDRGSMALTVWDGRSGDELYRLHEGEEFVEDHASLPNSRVVTADLSGVLRVWDTNNGQLLSRVETGLVFKEVKTVGRSGVPLQSGREGCLLTRDVDSVVRILDPTTGEILRVIEAPPTRIASCLIIDDGRVVTKSDDGTTRLWPRDGGEPTVLPGKAGENLLRGNAKGNLPVSSRDSTRLVTGDGGGLHLWDVESAREITLLLPSTEPIGTVAVGREFLCASYGEVGVPVRLWRLDSGESLGEFHSGASVRSLEFFADGRLLLGNGSGGAYALQQGKPPVLFQSHAPPLMSLAAEQGGQVFSGIWGSAPLGSSGTIFQTTTAPRALHSARFWDRRTGMRTNTLKTLTTSTQGAAFLEDGRVVLCSRNGTRVVGPDLEIITNLGGQTQAVTVSPAEDRIATLTSQISSLFVSLYTIEGEHIRNFGNLASVFGITNVSNGVFCLPDGELLATAHADHVVRLWDGYDGRPVKDLVGHTNSIRHLAT